MPSGFNLAKSEFDITLKSKYYGRKSILNL